MILALAGQFKQIVSYVHLKNFRCLRIRIHDLYDAFRIAARFIGYPVEDSRTFSGECTLHI